ncbi:magnesium transporter [Rubellimicrobium sp. CFH 75288]|uniref:magnesium transporter n=1 Tax=Rubellimicrobium sp. CFH 75288 TaxID=2697034 RepID=UPI00141341C6|nr:magnesium transporter [Rubellimicrobium sp. CFH 75288]NAZ35209.1 magnesium transporter [Rubellimicrobium sp. CFH 75288]
MTATTWNSFAISRYLRAGDLRSIGAALREMHPADTVAAIRDFPPADLARIIGTLPEDRQAELFGYLPPETQAALAAAMSRRDLARLLSAMPHDERADLFADLSEEQRQAILPGLAQAERDDLLKLSSYPEGSVGAEMTSDYATVPAGVSAAEAIDHLRRAAPDAETIYNSFVTDAEGRLVGTVSLRDLIVAPPGATVDDVMRRDPVSIRADAPRAEAVELIRRYDLLALPVLNGGDRLAGIVTYDDAMDVAQEQETLSFRKTGAVGPISESILTASIGLLYRKRVFWLVLLVFGNIFSGAGIAYFEDTIAAYVALVFFLPLLIDSGGNAGSQSATLMVRALATGDVRTRDWGRMLGREILVAGLLGLTMAVAVSFLGILRGGPDIALVVALTMVIIVLMGSVVGMSLPFLLHRFGRDPATASAPLITSIADGLGVLIYFGMATALLDLTVLETE